MIPAPTPVLRLITRLNIGGPARQALLLTKRLAPDFATVLAAGSAPPHEGELLDPEVPVTRVPLVRAPRPVDDLHALRQVRRLIESQGTMLVHTHMAKAGAVGRVAARMSSVRPRTVHTFHGHVLEGYFPGPVERAFVLAERALAKRTDVLVAVSPEVRDALLDLRIGTHDQFVVLPLGLPLETHLEVQRPSGALRARLGLAMDVPLIVSLGRLAPIKDHETLLRAVADVPGAHLAVLGDGELGPRLRATATELGIAERTHFTGWWHDVPAALADADVVVLTSRNEGTPVALIEAHACGRPAVATDVGGVRSVVRDGVSGWLVPPADPAAVAQRLRELLADDRARAAMGAAGREHVRERFGQDRLVRDIRELYTSLLSTASRG